MTIEQSILNAIRALSPEEQAEVLKVAESLRQQTAGKPPRKSGRGLWENLGVLLSTEDIDKARAEIWGNFPRADI